ncbi:unnamed protein product [Boreogadus saida]
MSAVSDLTPDMSAVSDLTPDMSAVSDLTPDMSLLSHAPTPSRCRSCHRDSGTGERRSRRASAAFPFDGWSRGTAWQRGPLIKGINQLLHSKEAGGAPVGRGYGRSPPPRPSSLIVPCVVACSSSGWFTLPHARGDEAVCDVGMPTVMSPM